MPTIFQNELRKILKTTGIQTVYIPQRVPPPSRVVYHSRGCDRLAIPIEGNHRMRLHLNGKNQNVSVSPGSVVWMPVGTWNHPFWDRKVKEITLIFLQDALQINRACSDGQGSRTCVDTCRIEGPHSAGMLRTLDAIRASRPDSDGITHLFQALCWMSVERLGESSVEGSQHKGSKATYEAIAVYLQECFQSVASRSEVADHFGITPNHVSRLFQEHTGGSFTHALSHLRMSYACELLATTELRVKEVSGRCGFEDANYFCRIFKRKYGRTPLEYRTDALSRSPSLKTS